MFNNFCLSSYLTFRYVVDSAQNWRSDINTISLDNSTGMVPVRTSSEVYDYVNGYINRIASNKNVCILLSGGIDSAILASFLPPKTPAITIRFKADGAVDESKQARLYTQRYDLDHYILDVDWVDYSNYVDDLMLHKGSPLHAVEVALYKAKLLSKRLNCDALIVGNGADSTFGGLDKLLSRDWQYDEFVKRYTFVDPWSALKFPVSMDEFFYKYKQDDSIDVLSFLKMVHGLGVVQAFENSLGSNIHAPYEDLLLDTKLDLEKIRSGESKYILREIFKIRYPELDIPTKIAFARPMDVWLEDWTGPKRPEFISNLNMNGFTGDQKWLIYCLERFMNINE